MFQCGEHSSDRLGIYGRMLFYAVLVRYWWNSLSQYKSIVTQEDSRFNSFNPPGSDAASPQALSLEARFVFNIPGEPDL